MREARLPDVGGDHVVRVTMRGIAKSHTADDSKPKDPVLRNDLERFLGLGSRAGSTALDLRRRRCAP